LYSLGGILAYDRILMLERVYSQMEYIYPNFGSLLISKFDQFGIKLDNFKITNQQTGRRVKFFRYDRMLLGDTLTEDKNGTLSLCSYKKFKEGA
jgi:hypothetical protein